MSRGDALRIRYALYLQRALLLHLFLGASAMRRSRPITDVWSKVANGKMDDKVKFVTGIGYQGGLCSGNIASVGNFSGLCIQDSALGVGMTDFVTAFPSGINTAAT